MIKQLNKLFLRLAGIALLVAFSWQMPVNAQQDGVNNRLDPKGALLTSLIKKIVPTVVVVSGEFRKSQKNENSFRNDPLFKQFFDDSTINGNSRAIGSGVIVGKRRLVVTTLHVVEKIENSSLRISLSDRREFAAEVILRDMRTDLAILRIKGKTKNLPYLEFRGTNSIAIGETVIAAGQHGTVRLVTEGIISSNPLIIAGKFGRTLVFAHTAVTNPGMSGGAVIGLDGKLVGIATVLSDKIWLNGISYAVPSRFAQIALQSALSGSRIAWPWFGAKLQTVTEEIADALGLEQPSGALITNVYPKGPANLAGLKPGDVITTIDRKIIVHPDGVSNLLMLSGLSGTVPIAYFRNGEKTKTKLKLLPPPEIPKRNTTLLKGQQPLTGVIVANLSPALADELLLGTYSGVVVLEFEKKGAIAKRYGIRPNDIIFKVNDTAISSVKNLTKKLKKSQKKWKIGIKRKNRVFFWTIGG